MFIHRVDEDISLKLLDLRDADRIFELSDRSRTYLREWLPWVDETTRVDDTKAFIQGTIRGFAENRSLTAGILYYGNIVGIISFNQIRWPNKTAEIGYWLGEGYQGKGIMTRAAQALVDYAFSELKLNKVIIRAATGNRKSRSIPERLGFTQEGCIRQAEWLYDHYVDLVFYGQLASEWEDLNKKH